MGTMGSQPFRAHLCLSALVTLTLADHCLQLLPSTAAANHRAIRQCLESEGVAILGPGTFLLPHGLQMPRNSSLLGAAGRLSELRLAAPTAITHSLLEVSSEAEVQSLVLEVGGHQRDASCCRSVMSLTGNNSQVSDVEVRGGKGGIGILFESPTSRNNVVLKAHVHHCYYGVAFDAGLRSNQKNSIEQSIVEDISCDAITFAGFGQVKSTTIRNSGFACGPPSFSAGAGFFCKGNSHGAQIESSVVSNTCGMALDVDSCSHMEIRNNTFRDPGYDFDNLTHCWGMPTAVLLDSQRCSLTFNVMENLRTSNQIRWLGDLHQVYSQVAAPLFSDLPDNNRSVVTFGLLHRPHHWAVPTIQNEIANNSFFARCDENNCTGVGYFVGRGTGLERLRAPGHEWGERLPQQPSEFNGNLVSTSSDLSDIGSVRCGENHYAPTASVCPGESDFPCNEDDYLHPQENFRNDDCRDYISDVHALEKLAELGQLRHPLPLKSEELFEPSRAPPAPSMVPRAPREDWIDTGSQAEGMSFHFG